MPFVYTLVDQLAKKKKVGDGDCVDLVKHFVPGLGRISTKQWKAGAKVTETPNLRRGTAIATFENGRYPLRKDKKHAAIFVAHGGAGFYVMDQWVQRKEINMRYVARKPVLADGEFVDTSNNALAFHVIEI